MAALSAPVHGGKARRFLTILIPALPVWFVWQWSQGGLDAAFANLAANWEMSLTMVFGSLVAGATSLGGGAVAFPVFTKVLQIGADDAKIFSLAIQSVGMGSATLIIVLTGIRVDWRVIRWGSAGGLAGILLGMAWLSEVLPGDLVKLSFTLMLSSFAVTLYLLNKNPRGHHPLMPRWHTMERAIIFIAGMLGGAMSGIVGNGIDMSVFVVMVLLFRMSEKTATPTSVILMAFNAMAGFAIQLLVLEDFPPPIVAWWLAAVPVVAVGAPLGAVLCSYMPRMTIAHILIALILLELVSTLFLVAFSLSVLLWACGVLTLFSYANFRMFNIHRYESCDSPELCASCAETDCGGPRLLASAVPPPASE